jgi:hypothetical protein
MQQQLGETIISRSVLTFNLAILIGYLLFLHPTSTAGVPIFSRSGIDLVYSK